MHVDAVEMRASRSTSVQFWLGIRSKGFGARWRQDNAVQVAAAKSFVATGIWISHLVLAEANWVLRSTYGLGHSEIALAVDMLLANRQVASRIGTLFRLRLVSSMRRHGFVFQTA